MDLRTRENRWDVIKIILVSKNIRLINLKLNERENKLQYIFRNIYIIVNYEFRKMKTEIRVIKKNNSMIITNYNELQC